MNNIHKIPTVREEIIEDFLGKFTVLVVTAEQYRKMYERIMTHGKGHWEEDGDAESGPLGLDYFGHELTEKSPFSDIEYVWNVYDEDTTEGEWCSGITITPANQPPNEIFECVVVDEARAEKLIAHLRDCVC